MEAALLGNVMIMIMAYVSQDATADKRLMKEMANVKNAEETLAGFKIS